MPRNVTAFYSPAAATNAHRDVGCDVNHRLRPLRSPAGPVTGQLGADRDGCGHVSLETEDVRSIEKWRMLADVNDCRRDLVFRLVRCLNKEKERQCLIFEGS